MNLSEVSTATAVHVREVDELPSALAALGLHRSRPTVVVVGGAAGIDDAGMDGFARSSFGRSCR